MIYLWLKYIHILSATLLFGTGLGTACVMYYGHRTGNITAMAVINRYVVLIDWLFTGSSGVIQLITGLVMVYLAGYPLTSFWIIGALGGYFIALCCWLPVVWLQIQIRNLTVAAAQSNQPLPPLYFSYFKVWFVLGWPAFFSLLGVFYLMVMKPL